MRQPSCGVSPLTRSCRDSGFKHLLRCLVYVEAQIGFRLQGEYIDTHQNHLADDLSRDHVLSFLSKVPSVNTHFTPTAQSTPEPAGRSAFALVVQRYFQQGLVPSKQRTYGAAIRHFYAICTQFNITSPFTVTEHLLCCSAAFLADQGLTPQKLMFGLPDLRDQSSLPMLKRVQAGI